MKYYIKLLSVLLSLALLLCACGTPGSDSTTAPGETHGNGSPGATETTNAPVADATDPQEVFRILTVETNSDQMNYQIKDAVKLLKKNHPDIKIEVVYFSTEDSDERDILLTQLRTEIIAGNGPDVYILPTAEYDIPLFTDVQQTITNGHFLDISSYYDADTELGKEELNTVIMDAGLWEGGRYVLPLRYNAAMYVVDTERLEQTGKDLEWLANTNVQKMMNEALAENNELLAKCAYPELIDKGKLLAYFPDSIDYGYDNILLSEETLEAFWAGVNGVISYVDEQENFYNVDFRRDFTVNDYVAQTFAMQGLGVATSLAAAEVPIDQTDLVGAASTRFVNKSLGTADAILPVRSVDNSVTAWVTWYGAVGSSCDNPDLAYEYLRCFLTEEYQWELNRPVISNLATREKESKGMVADGWPVRYLGMAEYVSDSFMRFYRHIEASPVDLGYHIMLEEVKTVENTVLTEDDLSFLDMQIDHVYFPTALEYEFFQDYYLTGYGAESLGCPDLMDPAEMAKDTLKQLTIQVSEG